MGNFFGGYYASAWRSVVVLAILIPLSAIFARLEPVNWKVNRRYLLAMTVSSMFTWGPLYYAILHAGIGISIAINYASIVIGMLFLGWMLYGEKFTKDKILAVFLGIVGLALVFSPSVKALGWLALIGASVSGFSVATNMIITKKLSYSPTQATIYLWLTSVVANFIMAVVLHEHAPVFGLHIQWLYLVFFALASIAASWSFVKGLRYVEAGVAGILGLLEVVFGIIFGILFFNEHPANLALLGVAVILLSVAIPNIKQMFSKF